MSERLRTCLVLAALALAGCGGDERERAQPQAQAPTTEERGPAPEPADSAATTRRERGDRSNEAEAAEMVAEALRRRATSVRCQAEHEAAYSFNRYRCRQGERRFVVRWQQYGSGQYSVTEVTGGAARVLARGIASFGG